MKSASSIGLLHVGTKHASVHAFAVREKAPFPSAFRFPPIPSLTRGSCPISSPTLFLPSLPCLLSLSFFLIFCFLKFWFCPLIQTFFFASSCLLMNGMDEGIGRPADLTWKILHLKQPNGNLLSVLVHYEVRGGEAILGDNSHIHVYENGDLSMIGGVHAKTLKNNADGTMDLALIEAAVRHPEGELYYPTTRLICLENSHAK